MFAEVLLQGFFFKDMKWGAITVNLQEHEI